MKKYFFSALIAMLILSSCSLEDSSPEFYLEAVPIESVDVPDAFIFGERHEISVTYEKPTECHVFNNFVYDVNGTERTVTVINTVYPNNNCTPAFGDLVTATFELDVTSTQTHIFKFFTGNSVNSSNQVTDEYLVVEVPVIN